MSETTDPESEWWQPAPDPEAAAEPDAKPKAAKRDPEALLKPKEGADTEAWDSARREAEHLLTMAPKGSFFMVAGVDSKGVGHLHTGALGHDLTPAQELHLKAAVSHLSRFLRPA